MPLRNQPTRIQDLRRSSDSYTLVEVAVAAAVALVLIGLAWALFTGFMVKRNKPSGVVSLTADSFLRQEARDGLKVLTERLQESIQVLEPTPGHTATELVFRDVLNNTVRVSAEPTRRLLLAVGADGTEEDAPVPMQAGGSTFYPMKPIRIRGCVASAFTAVSPTCVIALLTFADEADRRGTLQTTIRLRNRNLAR
ncbi:MAG: hypothetical protein HY814_04135 [Candidatus Riflebacteria bacterium]|nr:hypothetical protein [Candidatus Riflebacteria bacterium]